MIAGDGEVYLGRQHIGRIERRGVTKYAAIDLRGVELGVFPTLVDARNALIEASKSGQTKC